MYSTVLIFFFSALRQRMIVSLLYLIDHALSPITSAYGSACKSPFATYVVLTLDKLASNLRKKPRQQTIFRTQQKTSSLA